MLELSQRVCGESDLEQWSVFDAEKSRAKRLAEQIYKISEKVTSFFCDPPPDRPDFEEREGQLDMSYDILDAIKHSQHILVEAGVGIGKSYAYLVPLLLYNSYTHKPVVIATSTIALQEQLIKDVKYLQKQLGLCQSVTLAKGQTNYLCHKRADEYLDRLGLETEDALDLLQLLSKGCYDRTEFPENLPQSVWDSICIKRFSWHECRRCHKSCLYREIRKSLTQEDGIIICNQDFLTQHLLKLRHSQAGLINSQVGFIVVDEAHNLEDRVRNAATQVIDLPGLQRLIGFAQYDVAPQMLHYIQRELDNAKQSARSFFQCLQEQVKQQMAESEREIGDVDRFFFRRDARSLALLQRLAAALKNLSRSAQAFSLYDARQIRKNSDEDFDAVVSLFADITADLDGSLLWIEQKGNAVELHYCPRNMRAMISSLYFDGWIHTILTSATLTNTAQGSMEELYSYFISNTGFPLDERGILSEPKPSPFPYDEHAMIYYCDDIPHPRRDHDGFIREGVKRLVEILDISQGKALVLFTAKTDLQEVYEQLQQRELPYKVLKQQSGSSQDRVLAEFKTDVNSVLLGTGAYWEGIDIKGKSLSNLVIFRLPFPVPDPIIEDKVSSAQDGLMQVRVPEMIIKLKQGIGRLIRSQSDTGIVSIIDPRLRDAPAERYHDITWASLPIQNRTASLDELRTFYNRLRPNECRQTVRTAQDGRTTSFPNADP